MKPRLILVSLGLAALAFVSLGLQAQDKAGTPDKDEIITSEQQLHRQFADFMEHLTKLKNKLARGDAKERDRSKVLGEVLEECQKLAVNQEFVKMIEIMRSLRMNTGDLDKASQQSDTIARKLRQILDKLQSTTTNFSDERRDLERILKDLDKALQKQKIVEGLTKNGNTDKDELAKNQNATAKDTDKVAKDIDKLLDKDNKGKKGGEGEPTKGENKDGGKSGEAKGEAKDAGKGKQGESAKGEPKDAGKESKEAKGETKPGDKNQGGKPGDDPKSASKPGEKGKDGSPDAGAKGDKGDPKDKGDKGSAKDNKPGDPMKDKDQAGAPKDAGAKSGDPMKDSPQGAAKGDPKSGDKSPAGSPPPDSKSKPGGDPMAGGGGKQEPPVASKESKGSDKGGEGKAGGDAKGGEGKQGEAKSGEAKSGAAKDGGASPAGGGDGSPPPSSAKGDSGSPPPSGDSPKSKQSDDISKSAKKLKEAGYDQASAEDEIKKAKTPDALKKQADAIAKMEEAKKKLEKLLQQMREEEIERVLAALQARCEKMLMMQQQVLVGTLDVDAAIQKNADKKPTAFNKADAQKLSDREKEIVKEADKCIEILEAEGSAVAFPEVFQQIRADMQHVQKRLDLSDVYDVTQGIEKDIIETLKEMIAALKKARDDNQSDPGKSKPGDPKSGKPADPKLLELLQELKMVRSLQKRVNDRTELYGKRYPGEQAADPQIIRELRGLGDRQQRIQEIVRRIASGDNK